LIFKDGIDSPPSVLFLRFRGRDPNAAAALINEALLAGTVLEGRFTAWKKMVSGSAFTSW